MVRIAPYPGDPYCIDSTEVTNAQYLEFLKASPNPKAQIAACDWNTSFEPPKKDTWSTPCPQSSDFTSAALRDRPVVCVDLCDARAYCVWAGKRLCGRSQHWSQQSDAGGKPSMYEWYNTCSSGGRHEYPYGDTFDGQLCNGPTHTPPGPAHGTLPVGSLPGCRGDEPPFSQVYDLMGNVAEWTDESWCGADYACGPMGVSFNNGGARTCGRWGDLPVGEKIAAVEVGFRCCAWAQGG
jgi:formylglycine-generating enzyme required for sulfatase activity